MFCIFWGILRVQNKPKSSPSTIMIDSLYDVFVAICFVWFSPNMLLCLNTTHLHRGLISPKVKQTLWFVFLQQICAAIIHFEAGVASSTPFMKLGFYLYLWMV